MCCARSSSSSRPVKAPSSRAERPHGSCVVPFGVRACCAVIAGLLAGTAERAGADTPPQANAPAQANPGAAGPPAQANSGAEPDASPAPDAQPRNAAPADDLRGAFGLDDPAAPPATAPTAPAGDLRGQFGLGKAGPAAPADDLRGEFGLGTGSAPQAPPSCADGLSFHCAMASDPLDPATPYALSTWLPGSYLRRLPVGDATHDAVAGYALGAHQDEVGPIFGGATGLENRWTIDGAPADSLATGAAETRIPLAFLDGLLVTAGGFAARDRASTGGTIDARLRRGTAAHEVTADVWTSWSRDRSEPPIAPDTYASEPTGEPVPSGYAARRGFASAGPSATAALVATGPLGAALGGQAWYAAGVAPTLASTEMAWRAVRLVDADGDGLPDGLPGDAVVAPIEQTATTTLDYRVPIMARAGFDRGAHHLELSAIGSAARDTAFLGLATPQAAGVDRSTTTGDLIATWRATWPTTRARLQLAWHRSTRRESAHDAAAANLPQTLSGYIPQRLVEDPVLAAACDDTSIDDPTPRIPNCPVLGGLFASGGAGRLTDVTGNRPSATLDVTHRVAAHVLRAGATIEHSRLDTSSRFTGGELDRSGFPGDLAHQRFYRGACSDEPGAPCAIVGRSELSYRTIYAAGYVEDTFAPSSHLTINAGLRWELMWLGAALHFSNQLAPRVGVTWDPLGGGRSRLWASYGRTFAMLPAGLGGTVIRRDATVEDGVALGVATRSRDPGAVLAVEPDVRPTHQDEVTLGAEVALIGALRATLWAQGRLLRDGLESTHGQLGNPGAANSEIAATRETELVAASLEMAARDRMAIRAGVMWGRSVGTWVGPYDPRLGVTGLASPDWDTTAENLDGALPTDAGGRAFAEAERRLTFGAVGLAVATRLAVGSGRPRNVLASGPDGEILLLPRGAAGRGPVIAQANLRVAARWRGYTATLDLVNVFDRREPLQVDERYTDDPVRPIAGGEVADLALLQTTGGQPAVRRTAYQLPTAFQAPLSVTLGIHKSF